MVGTQFISQCGPSGGIEEVINHGVLVILCDHVSVVLASLHK